MNYEELGDFDINRAVEKAYFDKPILGEFNPCSNPSDAWPIIVENRISILTGNQWFAMSEKPLGVIFQHGHTNPLRAAMIVYLMMQEAK